MTTRLVSLDYDFPACETSLARLPVVIGRGLDAGIRLNDHTVKLLALPNRPDRRDVRGI